MKLFLRLLICIAPVVVFGASAAQGIEFTPIHRTGLLAYTPVCARTSNTESEQNTDASTKMHLAFACRCCGWQDWGGHKVCVHQCCN
jgi:hypothetical protein